MLIPSLYNYASQYLRTSSFLPRKMFECCHLIRNEALYSRGPLEITLLIFLPDTLIDYYVSQTF